MGGYKVSSESVSRIFFLKERESGAFLELFSFRTNKRHGQNPSTNARLHHDQDKKK